MLGGEQEEAPSKLKVSLDNQKRLQAMPQEESLV